MKPLPRHTRFVKPWFAVLATVVAASSVAGCDKSSAPPREPLVLAPRYAEMLGDPPAPPQLNLLDVDRAVVAAIEQAASKVREAPKSAEAWGKLGMVLTAHAFDDAAAACFAQTEILQPDEPRWPYLHAMAIVRTQPTVALPVLERAVALLPAVPTVEKRSEAAAIRLRLFELYLELARPEDAEEPLRQFLEGDPDNGRAHLIAARIALRAGRFDECLREVERAGYQRAAQKPVHELRAEVYSRQGLRTKAASERNLADAAPNVAWPGPYDDEIEALRTGLKVALSKADRLYVRGRVQESINAIKPALEKYPDSEWAWILLGRAQIRLRQLDDAESSLSKALAIAPNSADALFRMGVVHSLRNNHETAAVWFRKALQQKPDHPVALYNLGHGARQMGRIDEAIGYFRKSIECGPDYFDGLCALGDILADEGHTDEARTFLERAKQLRPRDRWVLSRLYSLREESSPESRAEKAVPRKSAGRSETTPDPTDEQPESSDGRSR